MTLDDTALLTLAVLFLAFLIRSTFGFGDALVGMPLLALLIPVQTAAPLVALVSITVALVIMAGDWKHLQFRIALKLVLSSLCGIPFGQWMLHSVDEQIIKGVLGVVVASFALFSLLQPRLFELRSDRWAPLFGVPAGVLGGAYNTFGPPLVIYGMLRRWPAARFRATLQGYFLPVGCFVLIGHAFAGFVTPTVLQHYVWSLPLVLVAVLIGRELNRRFEVARFERLIRALLLAVGIGLLVDVA
ncbi:MAG: permease [Planctomycetaceae bacterium]|nr:permease [Planctomycetaceae bacterium]